MTEQDRLRAIAREELTSPDAQDAPRARAYLEGLSPDTRRRVALAAAAESDARLAALGIDRLMMDGFEDDAVPALARRVAAGDDLTAFGYVWAHGDDASRPLRMYVKIGRHLLERLEGYPPAERVPVERFLIDGGFAGPLPAFSRPAVEARLARIEALAERRRLER